jgi:hypothetical protein
MRGKKAGYPVEGFLACIHGVIPITAVDVDVKQAGACPQAVPIYDSVAWSRRVGRQHADAMMLDHQGVICYD